jgi:hypothetical protein
VREALAPKSGKAFNSLIDRVARELVTVDHGDGQSVINTPLMYPGGSSVVVHIHHVDDEYFITDFGMGYEEALFLGASTTYVRHGKAIAKAAGIGFDNRAFFAVRVAQHQLPGAIATVANCSKEAVQIALYKSAERRNTTDIDALYQRLAQTFPENAIAKDVTVLGRSNKEWHVATLVQSGRNRTIFEPVSAHHVSIYAATTKFHDIAAMEDAPTRVAVVKRKAELKDNLAVLSQSANVIERNTSSEAYRRLANAA